MEIINKLTFDMAAAGMPPYIDAVQGDTFTRKVEVTLMTRGQVFDPSDGFVSVSVAFKKPDGTAGWYDTLPDGSSAATVISDGVYQVSLAPEMLTVHGSVYALFRFDLDGQTISTFPFFVRVSENPSFNSSKSENYYNVQTWDAVNASFDEIFDRLAKLEQGGVVIDDESISTETTWSSKNIVDKVCPSFNESGAVVVCNPFYGLPLEAISHIVPQQIGSGDPSPSNIRPITGYDSVKLSRTGKNLLKYPYYYTTKNSAGVTFTDNGDGSITLNGTPTAAASALFLFEKEDFVSHLKDGVSYVLSGGTDDENIGFYCHYKNESGVGIYARDRFTWKSGYTLVQIFVQISAIKTYTDLTIYPQLEVGTEATEYEPYRGDELTIDFGQTVYGGTLNWQTGELTIDRETLVFDGVNIRCEWLGTENGNSFVYRSIKPAVKAYPLCSYLKAGYAQEYGNIIISNENLDGLIAYIKPFADENDANAWLAEQYANGTPFTVCYELRTPIKVQLTPQEILALSGTNCLSSNTGDTEVSGKADPNAIIQDLYNKLNALTATMTALTGV